MPAVQVAPHKKGDWLVDYEEKVFEDVKADPGDGSALRARRDPRR
jgi:hypothetical protein